MQYILTDGGKVHSLVLHKMGYTHAESMPTNAASKVTERQRYLYNKGKSEKVQYLHSPKTQFVSKSAGAHTGNYSGKTRGFYYRTLKKMLQKDEFTKRPTKDIPEDEQKDQGDEFEASVSRDPGSRMNWMASIAYHNKEAATGESSHNASASFASDGNEVSGTGGCVEKNGCVASANGLAAIFGLYYYPECDNPLLNWTVKQEAFDVTYSIRMRYPNPNYKRKENGLWVEEPLNDWNKEALKNEYEKNGANYKTSISPCQKEK